MAAVGNLEKLQTAAEALTSKLSALEDKAAALAAVPPPPPPVPLVNAGAAQAIAANAVSVLPTSQNLRVDRT